MKLPDFANSTTLADAQQHTMRDVMKILRTGETPTLVLLRPRAVELLGYTPLLETTRLSAPSNLHVRQDLILSALFTLAGPRKWKRHELPKGIGPTLPGEQLRERGLKTFRALCTSGPLYVEGWSYFNYVLEAIRFHEQIVGEFAVEEQDYLGAIRDTFEALAAPDGFVPVTDTAAGDRVPEELQRSGADGFVSHPTITVWRRGWRTSPAPSHFCLHHDRRQNEFRRNLHVQPMFGHFTYHDGERWLVLPPVYEGWPEDPKLAAARLATEADRLNVPRGPWNAPSWRTGLLRSPLDYRTEDFGRRVILSLGGMVSRVRRIVTMEEDGISIVDEGPGETTLNLAAESGRIAFTSGAWATGKPVPHPLSRSGAVRYTGTGPRRAFKIVTT